jgi:hypothetical protein
MITSCKNPLIALSKDDSKAKLRVIIGLKVRDS